MQNGRELLTVLAQELDELSISIRLRLLSPPPISTIWLLLSADLCLNKFLSLPSSLQQFYASHLELITEETSSEVSYSSWKKSPEKEHYRFDLNTWRQQLEVETERPPPVIERVAPTPAQPITVLVKSEVKEDPGRNRQRN